MIYVFGDSHLWHEFEARQLLKLLQQFSSDPKTDRIILMGDMLDVCVSGQKGWLTQFQAFFNILKHTKVPLTYILGNRDFGAPSLIKQLDNPLIECHMSHTLKIGSKEIYLTHGDIILTSTRKYKWFRAFLRNSFMDSLIHCFPYSIVRLIARYLSLHSYKAHRMNPKLRAYALNAFSKFVQKKWTEGFDGVILGHTHTPAYDESPSDQFYLNCGFWPNDKLYYAIQPEPWHIEACYVSST